MSESAARMRADVSELLHRILGLPRSPDSRLSRTHTEGWDSLKHMEIIFALEDRYGIRFDESEFPNLVTTDAITAALQRHLAA